MDRLTLIAASITLFCLTSAPQSGNVATRSWRLPSGNVAIRSVDERNADLFPDMLWRGEPPLHFQRAD